MRGMRYHCVATRSAGSTLLCAPRQGFVRRVSFAFGRALLASVCAGMTSNIHQWTDPSDHLGGLAAELLTVDGQVQRV